MASWNKVELSEDFEITQTDEPSESERPWKLLTYSGYTCAATLAQVHHLCRPIEQVPKFFWNFGSVHFSRIIAQCTILSALFYDSGLKYYQWYRYSNFNIELGNFENF